MSKEEKIRLGDERLTLFQFGRLIERSIEDKEIKDIDLEFLEFGHGYPDALLNLESKDGEKYRLKVEFEGFSSNFKDHKHDATKCDLIICMLHDWKDSTIPVLDAYKGKIYQAHQGIKGSLFEQIEKIRKKEKV
jgi:hypothetical protein